ncbi:protein Wnt-5b isoform X2 [Ixodes scapularis]
MRDRPRANSAAVAAQRAQLFRRTAAAARQSAAVHCSGFLSDPAPEESLLSCCRLFLPGSIQVRRRQDRRHNEEEGTSSEMHAAISFRRGLGGVPPSSAASCQGARRPLARNGERLEAPDCSNHVGRRNLGAVTTSHRARRRRREAPCMIPGAIVSSVGRRDVRRRAGVRMALDARSSAPLRTALTLLVLCARGATPSALSLGSWMESPYGETPVAEISADVSQLVRWLAGGKSKQDPPENPTESKRRYVNPSPPPPPLDARTGRGQGSGPDRPFSALPGNPSLRQRDAESDESDSSRGLARRLRAYSEERGRRSHLAGF